MLDNPRRPRRGPPSREYAAGAGKGPSTRISESSSRIAPDGMEEVTVTTRERKPVKPTPTTPDPKPEAKSAKPKKMAVGGCVRGDGIAMKGKTKGRVV